MSWLEQQGPWCPELINHLTRHHRGYDALIFFTYLYAPTVLGLQIDPARSILVPTAHDEPAIRLGIYGEMFAKPAAVAFNTDVEKNFLKTTFEFRAAAEETVGCGVDLLQDAAQADDPEPEDDEELHKRLDPHLRARGAQFRRRHRLQGQFLLYGGRIDAGKGCEELIEYFTSYKEQGGEAALTLMGVKLMQLPEVPWVRFAGLLSERERLQALEAATIVVSTVSPPVRHSRRCQGHGRSIVSVTCYDLLVIRDDFREALLAVMERKVHWAWPAFGAGLVPADRLHLHF